jgi:protein TonB
VTPVAHALPRTANDRLKEGFRPLLALSLLAATVTHLLVFELWPTMSADVIRVTGTELEMIPPPDEIELPPPPDALVRPAAPVVSANVDPRTTIPSVTWEQYKELPPPPPETAVTRSEGAAIPFTPWDVPPRLLNPDDVTRALERAYPPVLRDAGITGTVQLLVHIDAAGKVLEARVGTSSGYASLDAAALTVVDTFRFRPAQNRDVPTAVWTRLPVTFEIRH